MVILLVEVQVSVTKRKAEIQKERGKATARADRLKEQTQEDYRQKLNLGRTISAINQIENHLHGHARGLKTKLLHDPQAMRWVLESKWKRLGKLMPDLKAVETSGKNELTITINTSYD